MDNRPSRDLIGYGPTPPSGNWPGGAKVAVNFTLNLEEGAERHIDHGDGISESILHEVGGEGRPGERDLNVESLYDYGARAGFYRLMRCFEERGLDFTINVVGQALALNPEAAKAIAATKHADFQAHSWRWIDYWGMPEAEERDHMQRTIDIITKVTGSRPLGWYTGRPSLNTRRLVVEEGGFLFDSDSYADDVPYWTYEYGRPHLIVPHSFDSNDSRFFRTSGFITGDDFFTYNRDTFDVLRSEGGKMMSIGLHSRLIGRPGRIAGLYRLLDHMMASSDAWFAKREDIARHWMKEHPAKR